MVVISVHLKEFFLEVDLSVDVSPFDKRQQPRLSRIGPVEQGPVAEFGESIECIVIMVQGDSPLTLVACALGSPGRFARRLDGWQEKADQDADDRDDNEKFDESEGTERTMIS